MTFHNYGPTLNTMNLAVWESLSEPHKKLMLDTSREAQEKIRQATEVGRQPRRGQEGARAQGHDRGAGQRRCLPQGRAGEDLARPTRRSTRRCGTRSRPSSA